MVGGDITLAKGAEDSFETMIEGVKPGIWKIIKTSEDPPEVLIRWFAPGPLDLHNLDNLPTALPEPTLTPLSEWKKVGSYSVDSGTHGLFDQDGLDELIREGEDRGFVLELLADYALEDGKLGVSVGFALGGNDGGYKVEGKTHENVIVELRVVPN